MLGWENVPPRHVLEATISALKFRAREAPALTEDRDRLKDLEAALHAYRRAAAKARAELQTAHARIASLESELSQARALAEKERDDLKAELLKTQSAGAE
jgi:predicted  nucleic acid-binding Zn-ribbon protein